MSLYQPENPGVSIKPEWLMRELSRVAEMLNIATAGGTIPPGGTVDNVLSVAPSQFSTGTDILYWRDINAEFLSQTNIPKDGKTYGTYWDGNSWEWIQSSSRWDATANGGINANYTRVGIGNDTPNTGLDVLSGGGIYYTGPGSAGVWIGYWDGATGWINGWHTANGTGGANGVNDLALSATAGIDQLYLKTDGNVGIGTDNPLDKLHVIGTRARVENPAGGAYTWISGSYIDVGVGETTHTGSGIALHGSTAGFDVLDLWREPGANGEGYISNRGTGPLIFYGGSPQGEKMRINMSNGNVGIGTASPDEKLEVVGNTLVTGSRLQLVNSNKGVRLTSGASAGSVLGYDGSAYNDLQIKAGSATTNVVYLNTSGNVGIGTSSPSEKLHVVGTELLAGNLKFSSSRTIHTDSNNNKLVIAGGLNPAWSTSAYMQIFGEGDATSPGVISLLPSQSGGVGIGTNSPSDKLHVVGGASLSGWTVVTNATPALQMGWYAPTARALIRAQTNGVDQHIGMGVGSHGSTAQLFLNAVTGYVGLGTNNPSTKLHVVGDITIT